MGMRYTMHRQPKLRVTPRGTHYVDVKDLFDSALGRERIRELSGIRVRAKRPVKVATAERRDRLSARRT